MKNSRRNTGYVGYSMSVNAESAREDGRYPKSDFMKEYHITAASLELLVMAGIIDNTEWHHTSKYFNRTKFYSWTEDGDAAIYTANKKAIDKMSREYTSLVMPSGEMLGGWYSDMDMNVEKFLMSLEDRNRLNDIWSRVDYLNCVKDDLTNADYEVRRVELNAEKDAVIAPYREWDEYKTIETAVNAYCKADREYTERRRELEEQAAAIFA